jgi:nitrous oxidase accessory protein NosD
MVLPALRWLGVSRVVFLLFTVLMMLIGLVSPTSSHHSTIHVKRGQRIQAAIDRAHRGDRIVVEAGTYAEQLTIKTDGITLVGRGAILVPPTAPKQNKCSGLAGNDTEAGICVIGSKVELEAFVFDHRIVKSVGRRVEDVSITGFQVSGFSGENIAVVGAKDARVTGNKLINGERYGFLTAGSKNTRVAGNTIVSKKTLRYIGICMDDKSDVQVSNNHITGYFIGLCVQTPGADVRNNDVSDGCVGVFVDPGIHGAKVRYNHISKSNANCSGFGGFGIYINGAINTEVRYNRIEGQTDGGIDDTISIAAGIKIDDSTLPIVSTSSGNVVTKNILRNNDVDLFLNTTGTGNVIKRNKCSTPHDLCGRK